jgi:DNA polymerase
LDRDDIIEQLKFAKELGVAGVSTDPRWRERERERSQDSTSGSVRLPPLDSARGGLSKVEGQADRGETNEAPRRISLTPVDALAAVRADIGDCTRCKLHTQGRTQVVFGVGNAEADLMFVGEAPGADEDIKGIPFVGRAGQLLTDIIEKGLQIPRDQVYIANVIKCRPPQNRNPEPDEVSTCEPFLFQQIDIIKPKVIVALGKFGAQTLLRTLEPISKLRGRVFDYRGSKLIPTFHPAYLLRNPSSKREVWEDMKLVRKLLNEQ